MYFFITSNGTVSLQKSADPSIRFLSFASRVETEIREIKNTLTYLYNVL